MKTGDRVVHVVQPGWGVGEVVEDLGGGKLRIHFSRGGEKLLKGAPLEVVEGERARDPLLDHRKGARRGKVVVRKALPMAIDAFVKRYPLGFKDPGYLSEERSYKVAAHEYALSLLGREDLERLLAAGEFSEVAERARSVVGKTNLLHTMKVIKFSDALKKREVHEPFARALHRLLYGDDSPSSRFDGWVATLLDLGCASWPMVTYFQYMMDIDHAMFMKPEMTRKAAAAIGFELNYEPELSWKTYSSLLTFADAMRSAIAELQPRDMIDVQSFIWSVGPDKK